MVTITFASVKLARDALQFFCRRSQLPISQWPTTASYRDERPLTHLHNNLMIGNIVRRINSLRCHGFAVGMIYMHHLHSLLFIVVNGIWVFYGAVDVPTLVVGGSGAVVSGNLSSTSIVLQGPNANLAILGCDNNLTTIAVELTSADLKRLKSKPNISLIAYSSDPSCSTLEHLDINYRLKDSSCRKISVSKVSSRGTLGALFSIDSSSCNLWWIILVSVLGGVIVLLLIILVLLVLFVPKVRPYSKKRVGPSSVH